MQRFKKGDTVKVISSKWKGTISKVVRHLGDKVVIEGVNIAKRAKKGQGFVEITKPIDVSNVAYYSEAHASTSKIGFMIEDGKKYRVLKKFNNEKI